VSASLVFAALESKSASTTGWGHDTVVLVGLDGLERAKATFKPLYPPDIACLGTTPPPTAFVAAGKVLFADGNGLIQSLSTSGQLQTVTTFSLTGQQMLSFAVSPNGSQLMASILTVPPVTPSGRVCGAKPWYAGTISQDVFSAAVGGIPKLMQHQTVPEDSPSTLNMSGVACHLEFVGWDLVGPFATYPTCFGPGGGPVQYRGPVVTVDAATGLILRQLADPHTCWVEDVVVSGTFICNLGGLLGRDISVRQADGTEIWRITAQPNGGYPYPFLSPDEQHVLAGTGAEVVGRDGTDLKLSGTYFNGWLDSSTVIGGAANGNLAYLSLKSPTALIDMGFQGLFVGTVQT
jgi:hypothetical protein